MKIIIPIAVFLLAVFLVRKYFFRQWKEAETPFPKKWKTLLAKNINFYNALSNTEKNYFELRVQEFLLNYQITGIDTKVTIEDKLMVAASGIIPIFKFHDWRYSNLDEIIIYPNTFNLDYETEGEDRRILGMVGNGALNGKMILSQQALRHGFKNTSDKKNTAIHEFVHLIDMMDGQIDGIPKALLERPYCIPWLDLMYKKIEEINSDKSDINKYGGTSEIEFFAVASEYFFERPKLLARKHPKLYEMLEGIFDHEMDERKLKAIPRLERNHVCPCDSGLKYKDCCLRS
ncbi:MAG: zinc-dependent peptidase [Saprospiraceae bacterium]